MYKIKVSGPDGESWMIEKRYRELRELHEHLRLKHPDQLPQFPGKRLFGNTDPAFVAARQAGLQLYLEGVLRLDPEAQTPALSRFLQCQGSEQRGERSQERRHREILDRMASRLFNLMQPPSPLDEIDMAQRLEKYGSAMRLHVLSQPVDPIHLRSLTLDVEPVRLCPTNSERFDALVAAPSLGDGPLLQELMDQLTEALHTDRGIVDPEKLIAPFTPLS